MIEAIIIIEIVLFVIASLQQWKVNMELLKQKLKTKKYQYLYLQEKLTFREEKLIYTDNYDGINEF